VNNEEHTLELADLKNANKSAMLAAGVVLGEALSRDRIAIFMLDAVDKVVLMDSLSVKILTVPKVSDEDLDKLGDDRAIEIMTRELRSEGEILSYLERRKVRANG